MRVYLLLLLVSAATTYLMTPLARWCALRFGAITAVRDRDVHAIPTPRLGGLAMLVGLLVALTVASGLPFLSSVFTDPRPIWGLAGGATTVCLLGVADDIWDLDWVTKLVGQVLGAGFMAWQGVLLFQLPIFGDVVIGSERVWQALTVLVVVVAMNAVNFVDGLDGLAAGMIGIGGTAFFLYSYWLTILTVDGGRGNYANLATLVLAVLVGMCVGFLPHNVYPARIFMGDSGSMLLGLVIAAATIILTGQLDASALPANDGAALLPRQQIPVFVPILLPVAVLLLPLLDMGLAVVRRVGAGKSPFHPDRMHLHHRLLSLGHSHRSAVGIMWIWTVVFAFGTASLVVLSTTQALWLLGVGMVAAALLTLGPLRGKDGGAQPIVTGVTPVVPPATGTPAPDAHATGTRSADHRAATRTTVGPGRPTTTTTTPGPARPPAGHPTPEKRP
ncbi:glycosyltransferase family 4 protein [Cellulomonas sp. 179-A 4D5 NHS]|uniref:glycosyltransferase family 4 protein n=1 Tax=Cellulomonas sp. 179-A 4D5 NHS TaxID=3142378 RepID=UPI0039A245F8